MKKRGMSSRDRIIVGMFIFALVFCLGIAYEMSKPFPQKNWDLEISINTTSENDTAHADYRTPQYVLITIDLLDEWYFDHSVVPPKWALMNIGLGAIAKILDEEGIQKSIILTGPNMTEAEAKKVFLEEFTMAKKILENRKNIRAYALGLEAVEAILDSFSDSHTFLHRPRVFRGMESFEDDRLGARLVELRKDFVYIDRVIPNQNAFAADLRRFDRIVAVNGWKITDGVAQFFERTKSFYGRTVKITLLRSGREIVENVMLSRNRFPVGVGSEIEYKDKKFHYIYLGQFRATPLRVAVFLESYSLINEYLRNNAGEGIILDLRGNLGGEVPDLVMTASFFLKNDVLLFTQYHRGIPLPMHSDAGCPHTDLPLVILVDRWTYSAGEVLAQTLKEYGRAQIVGEKTSGGVRVGSKIYISDKAPICISIAQLLTFQGCEIEGVGVQPDVEVALTEDDISEGRDPQLEKAKEILVELVKE